MTLLKGKLIVLDRELVIPALVAIVKSTPQRFRDFGRVSGEEGGVEVAEVEIYDVSDDTGGSYETMPAVSMPAESRVGREGHTGRRPVMSLPGCHGTSAEGSVP